MNGRPGWRRFVPSFSIRTLFEVVFVCAVLFYIWFNRTPDNVIRPDQVVQIDADGTLPDLPVRGFYLVDPDGCVNLGAIYGKVKVVGMTADEAQSAVLTKLHGFVAAPQVAISIAGWRDSWELDRVQALQRDLEELKMEMRSYQWKQKGLRDPQGPAPERVR